MNSTRNALLSTHTHTSSSDTHCALGKHGCANLSYKHAHTCSARVSGLLICAVFCCCCCVSVYDPRSSTSHSNAIAVLPTKLALNFALQIDCLTACASTYERVSHLLKHSLRSLHSLTHSICSSLSRRATLSIIHIWNHYFNTAGLRDKPQPHHTTLTTTSKTIIINTHYHHQTSHSTQKHTYAQKHSLRVEKRGGWGVRTWSCIGFITQRLCNTNTHTHTHRWSRNSTTNAHKKKE